MRRRNLKFGLILFGIGHMIFSLIHILQNIFDGMWKDTTNLMENNLNVSLMNPGQQMPGGRFKWAKIHFLFFCFVYDLSCCADRQLSQKVLFHFLSLCMQTNASYLFWDSQRVSCNHTLCTRSNYNLKWWRYWWRCKSWMVSYCQS